MLAMARARVRDRRRGRLLSLLLVASLCCVAPLLAFTPRRVVAGNAVFGAISALLSGATLAPGMAVAGQVKLSMPSEADCPDCKMDTGASERGAPSPDAASLERVRQLVSQNKVMVFSKSWCPYCAKAKAALTEEGVKFEVLELDRLPQAEGASLQRALTIVTGARTVPRVFVRGACVGGGSETEGLHRSGELRRLLEA
mmetsp:Transcript_70716/g.229276  ORF Transcript_70716/g.229276 Transcript_70716/m.229276 type:complete len:199 (-) Transcript_70716:98-694(-)